MSESQITSIYKLLRGAWGIHITVVGSVTESRRGERIVGGLHLSTSRHFSEETVDLLKLSLRLAQPNLLRCLGETELSVHILDLRYALSEFQIEGLVPALHKWLEKSVGMEPIHIPVSFDVVRGYVFDFDLSS